MPTYDYKCVDCGYMFEKFQTMSAKLLKTCPSCDGHVERLIGAGNGLIFKGSGFYITDYKKNNGKKSKTKTGPKKSKEKEAA